MKKSELRELGPKDLDEKLRECLENLQNYRFQLAMQQLEDFTMISKVRKDIAQIKTALKEYEIGIRKIEGTQKCLNQEKNILSNF